VVPARSPRRPLHSLHRLAGPRFTDTFDSARVGCSKAADEAFLDRKR
jgi:hypothetical protein